MELAGLHGLGPAELRKHLDEAGLVVSAAHVQLPTAKNAARLLDEQEALGNRDLVVAFAPPERFDGAESVDAFADELNAAAQLVGERGFRLGYHNHWWEFEKQLEGRPAHERLFSRLSSDVFAEVDTYWAQVGGRDPAEVVTALGERARMLHLKDGPARDPKAPMTALGDGAVDVPAIVGASRAAWHVVELDRCATDMFEAVEKSHRYLVEAGLAPARA